MSVAGCSNRNFVDEMLGIINEIDCRKAEPEACNVRCPPFGCPRGPCPGLCCFEGNCNACCVSKMPCCAPPPSRPRCRAPPLCCLKAYARAVGYPPESCLSPPSARISRKLCLQNIAEICPPTACPAPCYYPPPCCSILPHQAFPCS